MSCLCGVQWVMMGSMCTSGQCILCWNMMLLMMLTNAACFLKKIVIGWCMHAYSTIKAVVHSIHDVAVVNSVKGKEKDGCCRRAAIVCMCLFQSFLG